MILETVLFWAAMIVLSVVLIPLAPIILAFSVLFIFLGLFAGFFLLALAWLLITWPFTKLAQLVKRS